MKKLFYCAFAVLLSVAFSCNDGMQNEEELNAIEDSLKAVIASKNIQLSDQDSSVRAFIEGYNAIQENLDLIKEKEELVTKASEEGAETQKSKQQQIIRDIQIIYDALNQNKQHLQNLTNKLNRANRHNSDLEDQLKKFTERLREEMATKEEEITKLKTELEALNIELKDIKTNYEETLAESEKKSEKLNTAYYTFGSAKELMQSGVLTKSGGFIGIGKVEKMKEDFNKSSFTKIDISDNTVIVLSAEKAKVVSTHPADSYTIQGLDGKADKLLISDPESFWSVSKYLVVVTE